MVLEYKSTIGIEAITPILDEHVVWYGQMMRVYFERQNTVPATPTVFHEWIGPAIAEGDIREGVADRLSRLHADMIKSGTIFAAKALMWDVNPLKEFNEFTRHYEEFIQYMRRIEREQTLENSGIDEKTGLRSLKVMRDDLEREMQRRSRRGNPFSLGLVKINSFSDAWKSEEAAFAEIVRRISDRIKEGLRSFDDAYYLGGEYFLMALKHADRVGAQAASSRITGMINDAKITGLDEKGSFVTVSAVIAEPVEGDNVDDLIGNMKKDLEGINAKGTVLSYNELSPIQRYIHTIHAGK